jgi:hypothetical protein
MTDEKLNSYHLPGNNQIPAKLMQEGGATSHAEI